VVFLKIQILGDAIPYSTGTVVSLPCLLDFSCFQPICNGMCAVICDSQ